MAKDPYQLLKEFGYLSSPANRFFWKNASPTLRSHLRQLAILALSTAIPFSILMSGLTLLYGWDRFLLFGFYAAMVGGAMLLLDLVLGFLVSLRALERFWQETGFWGFSPILICVALLLATGLALLPIIAARAPGIQLIIWTVLVVWSWIAAKSCQLLLASRLYWHGIQPPRPRHYPILTGLAIAAVILFQILQGSQKTPALLEPINAPPMMILAFDIPEARFPDYLDMFPQWSRQDLSITEPDITNFWTELGTGAPASRHQTSLVVFETPFFANNLNRRDPTQRPPYHFFRILGLASPVTEGGRFRKYFWEIMDDAGLRTFSLAWWHTYPASSQNGGVLSERWTPEDPELASLLGFEPGELEAGLPLHGPETIHPTIHRENQSWLQLRQRAELGDFDLAIAYFPLADQYERLAPKRREAYQDELWRFRKNMIEKLLEKLPQETGVGILVASGKPGLDSNLIRFSLVSNRFAQIAEPFENHLEIAPTLLNHRGLAADRMMAASRAKRLAENVKERIDYGEPEHNRKPYQSDNRNYYEALRSLGYVQ